MSATARLQHIRLVMVETTHPGNIGAVARVMKNMCLSHLYLVRPRLFPHADATARASGATDILDNARVCDSLAEAIGDCGLVIGTSARQRTVNWPVLLPRQSAQQMLQSTGLPAALLLGRESSGLTNAELDVCQYLVHIPSNSEYNSLNVAMAAQVLAYEMLLAALPQAEGEENRATQAGNPHLRADEMQHFHNHLLQTLEDIRFIDPRQSEKLMLRLRRFFQRANPDREEMNILRGILSAAQGRKVMRGGDKS